MKRDLPNLTPEAQLDQHLRRLPAPRKRAITNSLKRISPKSFASKLLKWFDQHGRKALPWQQNPTPYRVWVSEIMLQQTQVSTVIPYFERFMTRFPEVEDLAAAAQDEVLHLWTGLGYYARARNLHKAAQRICIDYQGTFPNTVEALMDLPGIGQSTAGAVLSLSSNTWAPILDGNVKRVLARVHRINGPVQENIVQHHLWALSHHYTPKQSAKAFNQAMMDIGATLCTRSRPQCDACPLHSLCGAYQHRQTDRYPEPKTSTAKPTQSCSFLILRTASDDILLEKRPSTGIWGGLWGFPEFDSAKALIDASQKTFKGGQTTLPAEHLGTIKHIFTHFTLNISPVVITLNKRHNHPLGTKYDRETKWFPLSQTPAVGLAAPVARLLKQLRKDLKQPHADQTETEVSTV